MRFNPPPPPLMPWRCRRRCAVGSTGSSMAGRSWRGRSSISTRPTDTASTICDSHRSRAADFRCREGRGRAKKPQVIELQSIGEAKVVEGLGVDRLDVFRGETLAAQMRYTYRHRRSMSRLLRKLERRIPVKEGKEIPRIGWNPSSRRGRGGRDPARNAASISPPMPRESARVACISARFSGGSWTSPSHIEKRSTSGWR